MTDQPGGENPVSKLQPLHFRLILDDGVAAIYQALTVDYERPEVPAYTVTLTIASDVRREAEEQLLAFLGDMEAAFELVPEPEPDDGSPDDEEPFDIRTQMQIELNLISLKGMRPVGVAATVETSIGPGQAASTSDAESDVAAAKGLTHTIPPGGKDHYWYAYCNQTLKGTVSPTGGSGTIRKPSKNVNRTHPGSLTKPQIIVHSKGGMSYLFGGTFSGPNFKTPC